MLATLFALSALLPQEQKPTPASPTAPAATAARSVPAQWLPETTLAAMLVEPVTEGSALAALWQGTEGQQFATLATNLLQPALTELRFTPDDLAAAASGGIAIAFVGFTAGQHPDVLLVANLGTAAPTLQKRLVDLPQNGDLRVLGTGQQRVYLGTRAGYVAAGTDTATVTAALIRAVEHGDLTLAEQADFLRAQKADRGQTLARFFVRIGDLAASLTDHAPKEFATPMRRAIDVLGIADMHQADLSWQLENNELVSRWSVEAPRGEGLLQALAGTPGRLEPSLARCIPTATKSFGFFTVQFGTVYDELIALANAIQPAAAKAIEDQIDQASTRAGVDIRADIIGGFAGRLATYATPTEGEGEAIALLVELRQGASFARALGKLLTAVPAPLQSGTIAGVDCWRTKNPGGAEPAVAVVGNWLAIASTDTALMAAVRQLQEPRTDPAVLSLLRSLPNDATAAMSAPLSSLASTWLRQLPRAEGDFGTSLVVVRRTSDALIAEERADAGNLLRSATATLTAMKSPRLAPVDDHKTPALANQDTSAATTLRDAESEGATRANVTAVAALLVHSDPTVVARACWLLGEWKAQDAIVVLGDTARQHASADVRLQATAALARIQSTATVQTLTAATTDTDPRVRLCAMQALARFGGPVAATPALALLDKFGGTQQKDAPNDLVVALVTLHDVGDPAHLMAAATSVGFSNPQVGQALTFLFQGLSPRQSPKEEVTTLLAVLDHPEPMLRRYAIQRLGELRDPTTAKALEGRLAAESADLQPLIRVSLTQVRGDVGRDDDDLVARAKSNVAAISQMVERRWNGLGTTGKIATAATGGALLLGVLGFVVARRRSRRASAIAEAQALVEPSAGYAASGRSPRPVRERDTVGAGH